MIVGVNVGHFQEAPDIRKQSRMLDGFSVIRFMDWQQVNRFSDSPPGPRSIDDLPSIYNWVYKGGAWKDWSGVPLFRIMDVANRANARAWVCLPHTITDEKEIKRFCDVIITRARNRPIFEVSNELWNGIFKQHHDAGKTGFDRMRWQSLMTKKLSVAVSGRADVVLCGQFTNIWSTEWQLKNTDVSSFVSAIAGAPYFRDPAELQSIPTRLSAWRALADKYRVSLLTYEGGQHDTTALAHLWNDCEAMGKSYERYLDMLKGGGVDIAMLYSIASTYRPHHAWGLINLNGDRFKKTCKYDAVHKFL